MTQETVKNGIWRCSITTRSGQISWAPLSTFCVQTATRNTSLLCQVVWTQWPSGKSLELNKAFESDIWILKFRLQAWNTVPVHYRLVWQTSSLSSPAPGVQRSLSSLITTTSPDQQQLDTVAKTSSSSSLPPTSSISCTFLFIGFAMLRTRFIPRL